MTRVVVAPQARTDLLEITARLVVVAGPATADKWDRKLWKAIDGLADFPGKGAPRSKLGGNIRIVTARPYIVICEHERGSGAVLCAACYPWATQDHEGSGPQMSTSLPTAVRNPGRIRRGPA